MATKGDISTLDVLMFGGVPIVPTVEGYSRTRKSGVRRSGVGGGTTRQRKKFYNMPHVATVQFYLETPVMQDFFQLFINANEGKKFICHLAADRPIVEPYVCQAIEEWEHDDITAIDSVVTTTFEIYSVHDECLDEFLASAYPCMGTDLGCILEGMKAIVEGMPKP